MNSSYVLFFKKFSFRWSLRKLWTYSENFLLFTTYFCSKVERFMLIASRETSTKQFKNRIWKSFKIYPWEQMEGLILNRKASLPLTRRKDAKGVFFMGLKTTISESWRLNLLSEVRNYTEKVDKGLENTTMPEVNWLSWGHIIG